MTQTQTQTRDTVAHRADAVARMRAALTRASEAQDGQDWNSVRTLLLLAVEALDAAKVPEAPRLDLRGFYAREAAQAAQTPRYAVQRTGRTWAVVAQDGTVVEGGFFYKPAADVARDAWEAGQ